MFFEFFRNILIFHRYDPGEELHDGYFGAHTVVEIGEFHTNRSAAHHNHGFGHFRQYHGFAITYDLFTIDGHSGELTASATGCQNDMFGFHDLCFTIFVGYFQFSFGNQFSEAHDHIDLVLFHQELDAFAHFIGYATTSFHHGSEIGCAGGFNAEIFGMFDIFIHLGAFQQGLGGDTAPVQANTAQTFFFNHCCFKT